MDSENRKAKELSDGVIVCAGKTGPEEVTIHTASKRDAEWVYKTVDKISKTRSLTETEERGLHRNYYLDLAESEHSLEDVDEFDWNTRPVYRVTFEPTSIAHQRMCNWADENQSMKAPTDFTLTPTIAELIYRSGAHLMKSEDGIYIEFDAENVTKLDAELKNQDIISLNVGDLWRLDSENSKRFVEFAGIDLPNGGD